MPSELETIVFHDVSLGPHSEAAPERSVKYVQLAPESLEKAPEPSYVMAPKFSPVLSEQTDIQSMLLS
jgi:hypothetical protein